jgi:hypothetical protein
MRQVGRLQRAEGAGAHPDQLLVAELPGVAAWIRPRSSSRSWAPSSTEAHERARARQVHQDRSPNSNLRLPLSPLGVAANATDQGVATS